MATVDGLSVRVSAAVSQFTTGMSRAEDAAQDVSLSLRRLGASSSSAERELDSAGRSATTTAAQMGVLTSATNSTNASFMGLSATTIASLVPAMGALLAALTPVVAALGGLVAIAGAIGAIGLVGTIGAIATNTEMLKEEAMETLAVFKEEFAPVFDLMASAIVVLIEEFEDIIPELVPTQEVVSQLTANFLDLGSAVIDLLPAMTDLAVELTQEFLPPFVTWAQDVLPEIPGLIRDLVSAFRRVNPFFQDLGFFLQRFLPELMEFGFTALPVVADALGRVGWALMSTLQFVNSLDEGMSSLIAEFSLLAPIITTVASLLSGPAALAVAGMIGSVIALREAWQTNFAGIRDVVTQLNTHIQTIMPQLRGAVDAFFAGFEFDAIDSAASRFEATLSGELLKTLRTLRPLITQIGNSLEENEEEIQALGWATSRLIALSVDFANIMAQVLGPQIRQQIREFRVLVLVLDEALQLLGNLAGALQEVEQGNFSAAANVLAERERGSPVVEQVEQMERVFGEQSDNTPSEVNVTVEGDTDVVRDVSAEVVDRTNRRTRRNQGRQPNPN